jgi:hypothetical protein
MAVRAMTPARRRLITSAARDGWACRYCGHALVHADTGEGLAELVYQGRSLGFTEAAGYRFAYTDHVIPRSRGGTDHPDNLVLACLWCNSRKGARLLSELPDRWWAA